MKLIPTLCCLALLNTACIQTTPYLNSDVSHVLLKNSVKHDFTYVRIKEDNNTNELVVYGKLNHPHNGCLSDAQVILKCQDGEGKTVYEKNLTMRRQRNHQRGWQGAGFRARIPLSKVSGNQLTLSIDDVACSYY